jgi:hypothetical protein
MERDEWGNDSWNNNWIERVLKKTFFFTVFFLRFLCMYCTVALTGLFHGKDLAFDDIHYMRSWTHRFALLPDATLYRADNIIRIHSEILILIDLTKPSEAAADLLAYLKTEAEFINIQFRWSFWDIILRLLRDFCIDFCIDSMAKLAAAVTS